MISRALGFRPCTVQCRVQLVLTPYGPAFPKQGYHSSILVDSTEYSFSRAGITQAEGPMSHAGPLRAGGESIFVDYGLHDCDLAAFVSVLGQFFQPWTYDILRKNCNSFSDCAVYFLTGNRIEEKFRQMESIVLTADRYTSVFQTIFGYKPNPRAEDFDLAQVAFAVGQERHAIKTLPYSQGALVRSITVF